MILILNIYNPFFIIYIAIYFTLYPILSTIALVLRFRKLNRWFFIALRALVIKNSHLASVNNSYSNINSSIFRFAL